MAAAVLDADIKTSGLNDTRFAGPQRQVYGAFADKPAAWRGGYSGIYNPCRIWASDQTGMPYDPKNSYGLLATLDDYAATTKLLGFGSRMAGGGKLRHVNRAK